MFFYPLVLAAALFFGAFTDVSFTLLAPSVTRFHIPLLGATPSHVHSFVSLSLPSGEPPQLVNHSYHYGSCADSECPSLVLSDHSVPAIVFNMPSTLAGPASSVQSASEEPQSPATPRAPSTSWSTYVSDISAVCAWLAALLLIAQGWAILACVHFFRVALAVDVQRLDSPWSFYSPALLTETSCDCCRLRTCAPRLLVSDVARVYRTTRDLSPVLLALASQPPTPVILPSTSDVPPPPPVSAAPKKNKATHRGTRGGQRQRRRKQHQENASAAPPSFPQVTDVPPQEICFVTDGCGRVVSVPDSPPFTHLPLRRVSPAATRPPPLRIPPPRPPPSPPPPTTPSKTILGRTYSHCDTPPKVPATTTFRRRPSSPKQTLAIVTVRVLPRGKPNQRARRALAASQTLGHFLET